MLLHWLPNVHKIQLKALTCKTPNKAALSYIFMLISSNSLKHSSLFGKLPIHHRAASSHYHLQDPSCASSLELPLLPFGTLNLSNALRIHFFRQAYYLAYLLHYCSRHIQWFIFHSLLIYVKRNNIWRFLLPCSTWVNCLFCLGAHRKAILTRSFVHEYTCKCLVLELVPVSVQPYYSLYLLVVIMF